PVARDARPPERARWVADDQGMIGYGARHHGPRAHERPTADVDPRDHDGPGADGASGLEGDRRQRPVLVRSHGPLGRDGAWIAIVGEDRPGPDEDAILDADPVEDECTVLDLDAIADAHPEVDVGVLPDDAPLSEDRP